MRGFATGGPSGVLAVVTSTVLLATAAYAFLLALVYALQRKLIFIPNPYVADPRGYGGDPKVILLSAQPGLESLGQHAVEVGAERRFAAVYFEPKSAEEPVLVFFHGNADQLGHGAAFLGRFFQQHYGLGFYGVEYPGYGLARPGSPSEVAIYEAADAMLRHLIDDVRVAPSRLVLFGQSIGCAVALEMGRRNLGRKVVLLSPFTSMHDMAGTLYPFLRPALAIAPALLLDKFDNVAKAAESPLVRASVLVIHGSEDEIVPARMGRQLSELLPASTFLLVRGMGHNDVLSRGDVLREVALFARRGD